MRIRRKGLRRFVETGDTRGIPGHLKRRLRLRLDVLDNARMSADMDLPGYRLHRLRADRAGYWSVRVSGNWRLIFRLERGEAVDVDLIDYH
jgi:proteic killer suppression protein